MEAAAWSAIGLLGATLAVLSGALLAVTGRIQALGDGLRDRMDMRANELRDRIDAQGTELRERIDAQGRELVDRIDGLTARFEEHTQRHTG